MIQLNHKGGDVMNNFKHEVLEMVSLNKAKWLELKGKEQDATHENFISNVILTLDWVIRDIGNMKEG